MKADIANYTGEEVGSPLKAIRKHCIECNCGVQSEVKECCVTKCYLWPFRFGNNPYRKSKTISEEQKQKIKERLQNSRKTKGENKDEEE